MSGSDDTFKHVTKYIQYNNMSGSYDTFKHVIIFTKYIQIPVTTFEYM